MHSGWLYVIFPIFLICFLFMGDNVSAYYEIRKSIVWVCIPMILSIVITCSLERKAYIRRQLKNERMLKATLRQLRKSEEKYRTLVELCPDAIFLSVNGINIFSNKAGATLMGAKDPEELKGRDIKELIPMESWDLFGQVAEASEPANLRLLRLDGSYVEIEAASAAFSYDGQPALMCVARDVSERKKMEENMRLLNETIEYDKLRTEFFANISHEFKTPLNIILGSLQLMEKIPEELDAAEKNSRLKRYGKIMKQNCFRLMRLLNNIIDITRIESGFFELHMRNHNLAEIVKAMTLAVDRYVKDKGINVYYESDLKELVTACDADRIERIMLNLLSNAIKFTTPGDSIQVVLYKEGGEACISIKDSGIGIPEDKKDIIFEKFRQVDKSFTRNSEGSGIGLSLAKSLVVMHGGTIDVISEYGAGSEFIVRLPITTVKEEEWMAAFEEMAVSLEEKVDIEFSDIYF